MRLCFIDFLREIRFYTGFSFQRFSGKCKFEYLRNARQEPLAEYSTFVCWTYAAIWPLVAADPLGPTPLGRQSVSAASLVSLVFSHSSSQSFRCSPRVSISFSWRKLQIPGASFGIFISLLFLSIFRDFLLFFCRFSVFLMKKVWGIVIISLSQVAVKCALGSIQKLLSVKFFHHHSEIDRLFGDIVIANSPSAPYCAKLY